MYDGAITVRVFQKGFIMAYWHTKQDMEDDKATVVIDVETILLNPQNPRQEPGGHIGRAFSGGGRKEPIALGSDRVD